MPYLPFTRLPDYCKEILIFLIKVPTWDFYMLSVSARSREGAEQGASRELLVCWGRKIFGDMHLNISGTIATAVMAIENLNPFDNKCLAKVQSKPGIFVICCVTDFPFPPGACAPINTVGSAKLFFIVVVGWKGCWHRCQLFTYEVDVSWFLLLPQLDKPLVPKGTQQIPTRSTFIRILDQEGSNQLHA